MYMRLLYKVKNITNITNLYTNMYKVISSELHDSFSKLSAISQKNKNIINTWNINDANLYNDYHKICLVKSFIIFLCVIVWIHKKTLIQKAILLKRLIMFHASKVTKNTKENICLGQSNQSNGWIMHVLQSFPLLYHFSCTKTHTKNSP